MDKFDWQATESAPKDYPMEIVSGNLHFPVSGSLYVPSKKTIHHGWGTGVSSHLVGDDQKPIPERLEISFFSYTENQFYTGEFTLPYKHMLELFQQGYYSPKMKDDITYYQVVVGISPGGNVAVWLAGIDKTTEVFYGQAKKADIDWTQVLDNPDISREQFIQMELDDALSPEAQKSLKANGIQTDSWDKYRKQYLWQPTFTGIEPPKMINRISYFNGESEHLNYPLSESNSKTTRTVPKAMVFDWEWPKGKAKSIELYFDKVEIFTAFEKLTKNNQPAELEVRIDQKNNSAFSVRLRNEDEAIFLKRTNMESYSR